MVKNLYVVWIKIDETLPWIELKGEYQTRIDARKVAKSILNTARIKIAKTRTKAKPMKVAATVNR
jgi:hypothetical protein